MKAICMEKRIKNCTFNLSLGKEYEVNIDPTDDNFYLIEYKKTDYSNVWHALYPNSVIISYPKKLFIIKEEIRNQKLEELGI